MMKKWLLRNIPISRLEYKNRNLFMTKMAKSAKIDILFMTKTAEKLYPLGPHIPTVYSQFKGVSPPPPVHWSVLTFWFKFMYIMSIHLINNEFKSKSCFLRLPLPTHTIANTCKDQVVCCFITTFQFIRFSCWPLETSVSNINSRNACKLKVYLAGLFSLNFKQGNKQLIPPFSQNQTQHSSN